MNINARRYASVARFDKIRLLYPGHDEATINKPYNAICEIVERECKWSPEYTRQHVKLEPYWANAQKKGYYIQLTYRACVAVFYLDLKRAHKATEIEVKAYLHGRNDAAYYAFIDAVDYGAIDGRLNTYKVSNGAHSSKRKSGAQRSVKVGSNKSSHQGGVYKRQGERAGLEVAVRRKPLSRIVQETELSMADVEGDGSHSHKWVALLRRVAYQGYVAFEAEMSKRGVEMRDYWSHFSDSPDVDSELWADCAIADNGATAIQEGLGL